MTANDVTTKNNRGQWVNEIEGSPELSQSYRSRDEAIQAGRKFAASHGSHHSVEESTPTGVITDAAPRDGFPTDGSPAEQSPET